MAIDSRFYVHDSDRMALQALEAIPAFSQVTKAFMKVWSERQFRILNMSTNLRINENQLSKYYDMLPPICEKLGIEVPELYLALDVNPNAYTAGDTQPFIVITSGLLETLPEELIPTVLAHECGHIACHHCLYSTMGRFVLSEAVDLLGLDGPAVLPLQAAFSYWMRCSEFSADRAAALCDGSSEKVVEMCMRFAGFDKDVAGAASVDEFINQASEYQQMVDGSKWDKLLEFLFLINMDHPLNAVRAKECQEWTATGRFAKARDYIHRPEALESDSFLACLEEIPATESSKTFIGENVADVMACLQEMGFRNVEGLRVTQKILLAKPGQVVGVKLNGQDVTKGEWYPADAEVTVEFYEPETEEEVAAAHPGQLRTPSSSKRYIGRAYFEVMEELQDAGFWDISTEVVAKAKKGLFHKEGAVERISINGQSSFEKGEWFPEKAEIIIAYSIYV